MCEHGHKETDSSCACGCPPAGAETKIPADSSDVFTCLVCGMKYRDEATVKQCEAWCAEHHSCNLEIIQHAVT